MRKACEKLLTELNIDFKPDIMRSTTLDYFPPQKWSSAIHHCTKFCHSFQKFIVKNILFHPFPLILNSGSALQSLGDVLLTTSLNSWLHEQQSTLSELSTFQNFPDNAADILTIMIYYRSCEGNEEEAKFSLSLSGLPMQCNGNTGKWLPNFTLTN